MQSRDEVEGLHNCLKFSQLLDCLYQPMQTHEKLFCCLNSEQRVRSELKYKIHGIELKLKILLNEGYATYRSLNQKILLS